MLSPVHAGEIGGRYAHHRPAVGVEAQGRDDRLAGAARAADGGFRFVDRGHGFYPEEVDTGIGQRLRLLGEGLLGVGNAGRTERLEDLAGRADVAGDQHRAPGAIGFGAGDGDRAAVQLGDAMFRVMQLEAKARAAEGIGQDDVGARIDEGALQIADPVRMRDVPQLRRFAGLEAALEQVAAHGAIGQ